jgi:hypothetical protein
VSWSNNPPTCVDSQPPVFIDCNHTTIRTSFANTHWSQPIQLPVPRVVDNSGYYRLTMWPNNLTSPLILQQSTTIEFIATDAAGNEEKCIITVISSRIVNKHLCHFKQIEVFDDTPPEIDCPQQAVIVREVSNERRATLMRYPSINATDDSGQVPRLIYSIPPGSTTDFNHINIVTVTAIDSSNNNATCTFTYIVQRKSCFVSFVIF